MNMSRREAETMADLTQIGEVLRGRQDTEDLSRREVSKASSTVTPQEARERGLAMKEQPPEPQICQFCGQPIQPQGIVFQNTVYLWRSNTRCKCDKAAAYWREHDRKIAEEKARKEEEEPNRHTGAQAQLPYCQRIRR